MGSDHTDNSRRAVPSAGMPWWMSVIAVLGIIAVVAALVGPLLLTSGVLKETYLTAQDADRPAETPGADMDPLDAPRRLACAEAMKRVDGSRIAGHIRFLAGCGSRVPGYPGCDKAADYVTEQLAGIFGPDAVITETFDVPTPVDLGARLRVVDGRQEIALYGLWPNDAKPNSLPEGGVEGALVYCRKGRPEDFNGKAIDDSVVILDFDCEDNWLLARELGARAVIVIGKGAVDSWQAQAKFSGSAVDAPRFWARDDDVPALLTLAASGARVQVTGAMAWRNASVRNVYAFLMPGQRAADKDPLVLQAYYDSMSVVPAAAPGAEQSCGVAALLEVARALAADRDQLTRPICFLATSAHNFSLAGEADWCYRHFGTGDDWRTFKFSYEPLEDVPYPAHSKQPIRYAVFMALDLSSHDRRVAARGGGTFTELPRPRYCRHYGRLLGAYAHALGREDLYLDATSTQFRDPSDYFPMAAVALGSEMPALLGRQAFAWMTPGDGRQWQDTPYDTPEKVDFANVTEQTRTIVGLVAAAGSGEKIADNQLVPENEGATVQGDVVWYDRKTNVFVPEGVVPGDALVLARLSPSTTFGPVRTTQATFAAQTSNPETGEPEGAKRFRFGLVRHGAKRGIWVRAYAFDREGRITFALSDGEQASGQYPTKGVGHGGVRVVTFPCRSLSVFSAIDPQYLTVPYETFVYGLNGAAPRDYGSYYLCDAWPSEQPPYCVGDAGARSVFIMPEAAVKMACGSQLFGVRFALTGAPEAILESDGRDLTTDDPTLAHAAEGDGYTFDEDFPNPLDAVTSGVIWHTAYKAARDFWSLNDLRLNEMAAHHIVNVRAADMHDQARRSLEDARTAIAKRDYGTYLGALRRAWGLATRNYGDVRYTVTDTVKGVVFYFALLLPFCFFMERLLFGFPDIRKRIAAIAGIFLVIFLILRIVHPAFGLSQQPYVILLAFVILIMALIVLAVVILKFSAEVKKMKVEAHGMYESDVGRLSATGAAVSIGVSNLRKRKWRTGLTAMTLTLLTFMVISLMTTTTRVVFWEIPRDYPGAYEGLLFRNRNLAGMQKTYLDHVRSAFAPHAEVFPRFWKHRQNGLLYCIDLTRDGRSATANAVLGMTGRDVETLGLPSVSGGHVRGFTGAPDEIILPDRLAEILGIAPEEAGRAEVVFAGIPRRVVGIVDTEKLNAMVDLDGEPILPSSPRPIMSHIAQQMMSELESQEDIAATDRLSAAHVIITDPGTVKALGGMLANISVRGFRDAETIRTAAEDFLSLASVNTFVSAGGDVSILSSFGTRIPMAPAGLVVTIAIAALIVLNTMLGAVHERTTEIGVYSSVGLAPSHIAALFMAESAVFATIGAVLGYLVGQTLAAVVQYFGIDIGISLNYSSISAVASTLLVMAVVMVSTIWPARMAAALSVPDVSRKWRIPPPDGDSWRFEFPFTVGGHDILGLYVFLANYFNSHSDASVGGFCADDVALARVDDDADRRHYRLSLRCWIAPFDLGISQRVWLDAIDTGEHNIFMIRVMIDRLSGDVDSWRRMNRGFLNLLRKRFLIWRAVPEDLKEQLRGQGVEAVEMTSAIPRSSAE